MHRTCLAALALGVLVCTPGQSGAVTADELVDALGIPAGDIVSVQLSEGTQDMMSTNTTVGTISATYPPMGLMSTGRADLVTACDDHDLQPQNDERGDTVMVRIELIPPANMNSYKFNFYFLSREYPNYVGSEFNDTFTVTQQSSVYNGNIVFDASGNVINVNSALFVVTQGALLQGTGFYCDDPYWGGMRGGGTGWLTTISPCVPGETFTLIFAIGDVYDGIYDSGVFVDGFEWREEIEDEPHPAEPISLRFLSPKVGPTAGGQSTVIYGNEFTSDCEVSFGDQAATDITVLSSERLQVTTPANAEGMVDVRVWSDAFDDTLTNGYTYTDADMGTLPPELAELEPAIGPLEGGIDVTVRGGNLTDLTTIYFDGVEANCTVGGQGLEALCNLPEYRGEASQAVVLVEGINASGAEAMPPLTFTYSSEVSADDFGSGGDEGCSCGHTGKSVARGGALVLLLLVGLACRTARRREV